MPGAPLNLLLFRQLHLRRSLIRTRATLRDGPTFTVFRESICDGDSRVGQDALGAALRIPAPITKHN